LSELNGILTPTIVIGRWQNLAELARDQSQVLWNNLAKVQYQNEKLTAKMRAHVMTK
jgi:hypothetical protein